MISTHFRIISKTSAKLSRGDLIRSIAWLYFIVNSLLHKRFLTTYCVLPTAWPWSRDQTRIPRTPEGERRTDKWSPSNRTEMCLLWGDVKRGESVAEMSGLCSDRVLRECGNYWAFSWDFYKNSLSIHSLTHSLAKFLGSTSSGVLVPWICKWPQVRQLWVNWALNAVRTQQAGGRGHPMQRPGAAGLIQGALWVGNKEK